MKLENWLYKRACISGAQTALVCEGMKLSFKQLYQEAYALSEQLRQLIGGNQRRIAILSANSAQMYVAILGLQQMNCEMVLLNTRLTAHELHYQVNDSEVSTLLVESEFLEVARHLSQLMPQLSVYTLEELCQEAGLAVAGVRNDTPLQACCLPRPLVEEFDFDQVTSILYTSGTTGSPKGVMQSFGNHWWSATASVLNLGLEPSRDVWICITPLFHISGLSIIMRSLVYGMPVMLYRKFDPNLINDVLCSGEGTIISVVTYHLRELIAALGDRSYHQNFRCMLLGGGFVEEHLLAQCAARGIRIIQSFGMTETCSQVIALSFQDAQRKIGSVGLPLMPNALRIAQVSDDGQSGCISTSPGEPGEIQLKSPALFVGYLNKEEKYRTSFTHDGWFKTGDIGVVDEEGYLYIKSRLTEMIISGGENIYPSEIEHYLLTADGVAEAVVVGHPDSVWNMVPWAYLVCDAATEKRPTDEALSKYLRGFLAGYKIPKRYIWVDHLPKTATGKIEKYKLVERDVSQSDSENHC